MLVSIENHTDKDDKAATWKEISQYEEEPHIQLGNAATWSSFTYLFVCLFIFKISGISRCIVADNWN